MPLSKIQAETLAIIAASRTPESYVAEGLIAEIWRNLHHPQVEWESIALDEPVDPAAVVGRVRAALDAAEQFVARMPTEKMGLLFLKGSEVVQPDPDRLEEYQTHAGSRGGHWPSDPAIQQAMLERYTR